MQTPFYEESEPYGNKRKGIEHLSHVYPSTAKFHQEQDTSVEMHTQIIG
jgi:hypothetical protein